MVIDSRLERQPLSIVGTISSLFTAATVDGGEPQPAMNRRATGGFPWALGSPGLDWEVESGDAFFS